MKKIFYLAIILIIVLFVLPFTLFVANIVYNNAVLNIYEYKISKVSLPEGCEVISTEKRVGNFYGNGDSIDFMVYYIVKTEMTEQEMEDYFKAVYVPPAKFNQDESVVTVNEQPERFDIDIPKGCMLIIFIDEGYPALLDIRGA